MPDELQVKAPVPVSGDDHAETTDRGEVKIKDSPSVSANDDLPPIPPPKPKRPLSPFAQACSTLKEAFPDADDNVVRAVLVAASGKVEPAFNGLLALSDPSIQPDMSAATAAPASHDGAARGSRSQIDEDEALARKLAQQFEGAGSGRSSFNSSRRVRSSGYSGRYDETRPAEPERSFFDDDLPELKENLQRGFNETKTKVSSWVSSMRKKVEGEDGQLGFFGAGSRNTRDSSDLGPGHGYERARRGPSGYYDRDPAEMTADDFQGISLKDEDRPLGERLAQRRSTRGDGGPPPPKPPRPVLNALGDETNKWEPLKSVNPEPVDKDPFFIGESDDEDELEEADKKGGEKVSKD